MSYAKQVWVDGLNKYNITDQNGNVIESNVKIVNVGGVGTPFSAARINYLEEGVQRVNLAYAAMGLGGLIGG